MVTKIRVYLKIIWFKEKKKARIIPSYIYWPECVKVEEKLSCKQK